MFGLFKKKPKRTTINVTASINAKLMPIQRGEFFGDPMNEWLKKNNLGFTEDGGCGLTMAYEPDFCDLELELYEVTSEILDRITDKLETLGAPKGSKLRWDDQIRAFGKLEGLALYLNGTDLSEEVYENNDSNLLAQQIGMALVGKVKLGGSWNGPTETGIYLYGDSFEEMNGLIADVLASHPLCENCRVVQIAPRPEGDEI